MAVSRSGAFKSPFPTVPSERQYPPIDMEVRTAQRRGVHNVLNLYDATPEQVKQSGMQWYDRVNEATAKGVRSRGLSLEQGAGIVAAVSPNMDWERNNISAFDEISKLRGGDWDTIHRAAGGDKAAKGEMKSRLSGLSIATSPAANLVKANRIMEGEDVNDVLPRRTAPKTNSFAANIADPGNSGPVTVDGRAHDIIADRLQPWKENRNIGSAALKTGKPTRYERMEQVYRTAADVAGIRPHEMQAVTWEGGKGFETLGTTKSGDPRVQGVQRVGQGYGGLINSALGQQFRQTGRRS